MNKDLNNGCVNTRVAYSHNHVCGHGFINKISSVSPTLFNVLKYYMFTNMFQQNYCCQKQGNQFLTACQWFHDVANHNKL